MGLGDILVLIGFIIAWIGIVVVAIHETAKESDDKSKKGDKRE